MIFRWSAEYLAAEILVSIMFYVPTEPMLANIPGTREECHREWAWSHPDVPSHSKTAAPFPREASRKSPLHRRD